LRIYKQVLTKDTAKTVTLEKGWIQGNVCDLQTTLNFNIPLLEITANVKKTRAEHKCDKMLVFN